ncbi:MAG TPA: VOC family protein [Lacunisphaera sp.]|nr:VOC family protein [Lacunisphaera sp.]
MKIFPFPLFPLFRRATLLALLANLCIVSHVSQTPSEKPMPTLTPYLLLDGTCQPAMQFYQACLGGELTLTLVGDSLMKAAFPASMHHRVVNARLVSGPITISASDWLRPRQTPVQGNTVCLYLSGGTHAEIKTLFDRLAVGADVTDPLRDEPFGAYGALTDRFGVRWMFHAGR